MRINRIVKMFCLNAIVFLAAFLLFQIELIVAKLFLPKFGGSYLVWGACVVFFQGMLLLGYLYSHIVAQKFSMAKYRYYHVLLVFLSLLFFPAINKLLLHSNTNLPLVITISWQLLTTIGLTFFVLSTTSIIFQSWLVSSELPERSNPYILYAVSNLGSFAALLSYPFYFEMFFKLSQQLDIWRIAYFVLAFLHLLALKIVPVENKKIETDASQKEINSIGLTKIMLWLLLSAASTIMFLSVTNIITYDILPMSLLWIMPLAIYLATFVFNFKKKPWCPAWITERIHLIIGFALLAYFLLQQQIFPLLVSIFIYLAILFLLCMFCHRRLNNCKPINNGNLTLFYFSIATGSFLGGIVTTWIIPLISTSMVEYLAGLLIIAFVLFLESPKKGIGFFGFLISLPIIGFLLIWPKIFPEYNLIGLLLLVAIFHIVYSQFKTRKKALWINVLIIIMALPWLWEQRESVYKKRNYYGIYKVYDGSGVRYLMNGITLHGMQLLEKDKQLEPLVYYHSATPAGALLNSNSFSFSRVGVVGLGAGTLAVYANKERKIDFFELDSDVFTIACKYFSFLKKQIDNVRVIFGDARITLEKQPENYYDMLIVDAFSSDSIPTHLLTSEAISLYRKHIKKQGFVLFHISSRFIDLCPILLKNAQVLNARIRFYSNDTIFQGIRYTSRWVLFTWDSSTLERIDTLLKDSEFKAEQEWDHVRGWTDNYSPFLPYLRVNSFISEIKEFKPFYWNFKNISQIINAKDSYADLLLEQGATYWEEKHFQKSLVAYKKAIKVAPKKNQAYFGLGKALAGLGRYEDAIAEYNKALAIDTGNSSLHFYLGRGYASSGHPEQAITNYKKSIALDAQNSNAYFYLAKVYASLNQYEDAVECFLKTIELEPQYSDVYYNLGLAYFGLGKHYQAIESFQKAMKIDPDLGYAKILYDLLQGPHESVIYYQDLLKANPLDSSSYLLLGKAHARLGSFKQAIENYRKSLQIDELNAEAHLYLGMAYIIVDEKQKALQRLLRAKELYRSSGDNQQVKAIDEILQKFLNDAQQ